jgi:AbiV family abortive infection protein
MPRRASIPPLASSRRQMLCGRCIPQASDNPAMTLTAEARSRALTLIDGLKKTIVNADQLFDEGRIMAGAGRTARALLLHQISLEECGKAEILHAALTEELMGKPADFKKLARVLAKHAVKNGANAYFLPRSEEEMAAIERDDSDAAGRAFDLLKSTFHLKSNDLKNASLYVDFNGAFVSPSEAITEEQLDEIHNRNGSFMFMAMQRLGVVAKWESDLDAAAASLSTMMTVLDLDKLASGAATPKNVEQYLQDGIQKLLKVMPPSDPASS